MNSFSVIVNGFDLESEVQNRKLEYVPYDASAGSTNGVVSIDIECDSLDPIDSVARVDEDLKSIGVTIVRIDLDLVNLPDIAERADSTRETVRLWSIGARRSNFPAPFTVAGASKLWAWVDVYDWLIENRLNINEFYSCAPLPLFVVEAFNGAFAQKRNATNEGWISPARPSEAIRFSQNAPLLKRSGWALAGRALV